MAPPKQKADKYKKLVQDTFEMDDDLIKHLKEKLKEYKLDVKHIEESYTILDEFLSKSPRDLASMEDVGTLETYLFAVLNWKLYIKTEINLMNIYANRRKRELESLLRVRRLEMHRKENIKYQTFKTLKEFREFVMGDPDPKNAAIQAMSEKHSIAQSNAILMNGYDAEIKDYYFTLQAKIKRIEIRTQYKMKHNKEEF